MTAKELKRTALLFLFPTLLFFFPFFGGHTLFVGDVTTSFHPWFTYAAQEIQAGHFPLWNPYSSCGEPFIGNPQIMIFNPTAILYWLFPFARANTVFLMFSTGLLFFFTYFLARRWIGQPRHGHSAAHAPAVLAALAFAWSGFALSHWEFPPAIATLPYIPLLFLLALGQRWSALAASVALALFTGYIQFVYYAVFMGVAGATTAATAPGRTMRERAKTMALFTAAIAGGIVIAMAQILPSWESAHASLRNALTSAEAHTQLLTPAYLLKLWIPRLTNPIALAFQSTPFGAEFWSIQRNWLATFFLGTPICLLAVVGFFRGGFRKFVILGTCATAAGILAFGLDPLFEWGRNLIPGFRYLTHFSNASVMGLLCLVLWATEGAHPRRGRNFLLALATMALLTASLGLAVFPAVRLTAMTHLLGISSLTPLQDRWVMEAGGTSATALLVFGGIWLFFRHKRWAVLWSFTLVELWLFGRALAPTAPPAFFHRPLPLAATLEGSSQRLSVSPATMKGEKIMAGHELVEGYQSLRYTLTPNVGLPFRVHHTWGYEVFGYKEFSEFRRRIPDLPGESPALDFLGANRILSTTPLSAPSLLLATRENALLYTRPHAMERVMTVARTIVLPSAQERLDYLFGPWTPTREVVLETTHADAMVNKDHPTPRLKGWTETPGHVRVKGKGQGWMVHSGIYFPGWEATVNGQRATLLRANHAFQSVATPDGDWTVHLRYRPRLFHVGLLLTLVGLGCLFMFFPRPDE